MRTSNIIKKSLAPNEKAHLKFSICSRYLKFKISASLLKWAVIFILIFIGVNFLSQNSQIPLGQTTSNSNYFGDDIASGNLYSYNSNSIDSNRLNTLMLISIISAYILIVIPASLFYNLYYLRISNEFIFTNKRILIKKGWISTKMISISYSRITDISITQSLVDRLLNIGSLSISTAGSEGYKVSLVHIQRPHRKKKILHELKEKYRMNYRFEEIENPE